MTNSMELGTVTSDDFRPFLKQKFLIYATVSESIETELIQVKDLASGYQDELDEEEAPPRRKAFSLIFRSNQKDSYFPQRIYTVQNEQIGSLDIFLVPLGPDKTGMRYQAIFS